MTTGTRDWHNWKRWLLAGTAVFGVCVAVGVLLYWYKAAPPLPEEVTSRPSGATATVFRPSMLSVRASRVFTGPEQYPPKDFAAYGIVAFRSAPTDYDSDRFLLVCEAYSASLPHTHDLKNVSRDEQMVTVWPVTSIQTADGLNAGYQDKKVACEGAVGNYNLVTARQAIREAELAGVEVSGRGPYLLAWSPARTKGKKDALVLVANLSDKTTYDDVRDVFMWWAEKIEQNPELWKERWNIEKVRVVVREWADKFGPMILSLVMGKS
jgi:hypothetical protein